MKAIRLMLIASATLAVLASCKNDDTDFGDLIHDAGFVPREVEADHSALAEPGETFADDDDFYVENGMFDEQVSVAFDGTQATVSARRGVVTSSVEGAHVTINAVSKNVEIVVSGQTTDGSLKIYSRKKFKLVLGGADIHNPQGAAINCQSGKAMYLVLADGTSNSLSCGTSFVLDPGEKQKGALFSEGQILFSGTGSLNVVSGCRNGIASDDYLLFRPGVKVDVESTAGNALKANDGIYIRGGVLNLTATADGAKAVNCEDSIKISGGRTTAICGGTRLIVGTDTTNVSALKCDSALVVTGGVLAVKATGAGAKGINAGGDIVVSGGDVCAMALGAAGGASPKAVKSDRAIAISGGALYAYSRHSSAVAAGKGFGYAAGYKSVAARGQWFFQIGY